MLNHIQVESVELITIRAKLLLQYLMGRLGSHRRGNQPEPARHAMDVRVDRHRRHSQAEEQNARGSLGANPRQASQRGSGGRHGQSGQPIEIQGAALCQDGADHRLDAGSLLIGEAAAANRRREFIG